jgi:Tol biopolymer transport system component
MGKSYSTDPEWTHIMKPFLPNGRRALPTIALGIACLSSFAPLAAPAQYFGRNKVQYDRFDFRILNTEHFAVHFYPAESLAAWDAARMAERWYKRHAELLRHSFTRNPLIFYADQPDFQQSNVIPDIIEQGTGGVTEGAHERVIMPFTGIYASNDHVLGHELVHVFQYKIAEATEGGLANLDNVPLWMIEGMAEYLSLGRDDANTAMWLRDALRRNDLPSISQLNTDPRYFPYRFGEAMWAFIGGTWGDASINRVYRAALGRGFEEAFRTVLGVRSDSLSRLWHRAIRSEYEPQLKGRQAPDSLGRGVIGRRGSGNYDIAPAVSPDGSKLAFFSSRGLFGIDLYVADATTGRILRQLTSATRDAHFDALSYIASAGSWSPDGRQIAVVVYVDGDNAIDILDAQSGARVRRIKIAGVTSMSDPAWSPDGSSIAFSGMRGGISDLYLYSLPSGRVEQLTDDREAQVHPAWSPDGRFLAYATDQGDRTRFDALTFGPLRLALLDLRGRTTRLLPTLGNGKAINPQFSPDGTWLYFIGDQDGFSDIYRLSLADGTVERLTHVATGVSGITALSPALSLASRTGELFFSVFHNGGFAIRSLPAGTRGEPLTTPSTRMAALLPPAAAAASSAVEHSLADASSGLPSGSDFTVEPYRARLSLDYVGGPSVGVAFGGGLGTGVVGGVALGFSDMLGNHSLDMVVQAQGTLKDLGGELLYLDRTRRFNWGVEAGHIPYASGYANYAIVGNAEVYTQVIQRTFFDQLGIVTQYPWSMTRRFELSAGLQRISFDLEVDSIVQLGPLVRERRVSLPTLPALNFTTAAAALVFDNSFFGFTSPVAGGRYRFEVAPYTGSLTFTTALADYRRYLFFKPFTLAFRAAHFGRYGSGAESQRLQPLYVGQPYLVRGYDVESFDARECTVVPGNPSSCPEFDRLVGSRMALANLEFRIPLLGTRQLGLIPSPLPVEVAPFADGGAAWSRGQPVTWRLERNGTGRVPVLSTGVTTRVNLFGFAVAEFYWVKPYQRPLKGTYWGFQLMPGW